MDKKTILKKIKYNYSLEDNISLNQISQFNDYPHIFKIKLDSCTLIAKVILKSRIHCRDINNLYSDISQIDYIEKPILTKEKKYSVSDSDEIILLYEKLKEIEKNPNAIWWAKCLSSIHIISDNGKYNKYYDEDFYNQTLHLLATAEKYISDERKQSIYDLLNKIDLNIINKKIIYTVCHNDPYNLNVMTLKNKFKLIDTDGIGLSPKEYDIQRLLYNNVINSNDVDDAIAFWSLFKNVYEETSDNIDVDLLKNLYILDFVRTLSWLYIVSNDLTRIDILRQKEQLTLFEKSIDCETHQKILRKI